MNAIKAGSSRDVVRLEPSNWDEDLNENNFHEIVNDHADMYEQIEDDTSRQRLHGQQHNVDCVKSHIGKFGPHPEVQNSQVSTD